MKWKKLGLIFCAQNESVNMQVGARTPVPYLSDEDIFKIYFSNKYANNIVDWYEYYE